MPVLLLLLILLLAPSAFAFRYETPLEDSAWRTESTVFGCSLTHDISGYGQGQFIHKAGGPQHLELNGQGYEFARNKVQIISYPPDWRPGYSTRVLSDIKPTSGDLVVSGELVTDNLAELDNFLYCVPI